MQNLYDEINRIYDETFPDFYCKKFSGALAVELMKRSLKQSGVPVSPRDVFIKGVGIEIDLIVPKLGVRPKHNLIYEAQDVIAAMEIKYRGTFALDAVDKIRANFEKIQQVNKHIQCLYITVIETKGYKGAVLTKNLKYPAYTFNWWCGNKLGVKPSKDWNKLVHKLTSMLQHAG